MTKQAKTRLIVSASATVVVLVVGAIAVRSTNATTAIPTAVVKRGEFVESLQIRGEIRAEKSKVMTAPSGSGDLQIIKLQPTGTMVKAGEIVVQFDPTNLQRTLEQKQNDLVSAEALIKQQEAQGHLTEEQNMTDTLSAKYNVERAKLDANKQEILSEIDGEKTKLALVDTKSQQSQADTKLSAGRLGVEADIETQKQKREKAQYDVKLTERQISSLTLRSPSDGTVNVMPNYRGSSGNSPPEFKEGDRAWPGAAVAEIPDLASIRFETRIDESDRGQLKADQKAVVHVDAVPDREFSAHIKDISTLAKLDFSGWPPTKNFALVVQIDNNDPRVRPGMSSNCRIDTNRIQNSIMVPLESVFQKNGRYVVYVQHGSKFDERPVEVGHKNATSAHILGGIDAGEIVALKDPTEVQKK